MSREAHVQFCESLGVKLPGATHLVIGKPALVPRGTFVLAGRIDMFHVEHCGKILFIFLVLVLRIYHPNLQTSWLREE